MFVRKVSPGLVLLALIAMCGCGDGSSAKPPTASLEAGPTGSAPADNSGSDFSVGGTAGPGSSQSPEISTAPTLQSTFDQEPAAAQPEPFPVVTMVTSLGEFRLRLNAQKAPETVDNFLYNYVDQDFYVGTVFHYVQDGFIAIAGGYDAELQFKEAKAPIRNEADNGLKNIRGTIAMSRDSEYADSATSQFYFNLVDNPSLDQTDPANAQTAGYCVFGEVIEGLDVLDKIAKVDVREAGEFANVPVEPIVIQSVRRDK